MPSGCQGCQSDRQTEFRTGPFGSTPKLEMRHIAVGQADRSAMLLPKHAESRRLQLDRQFLLLLVSAVRQGSLQAGICHSPCSGREEVRRRNFLASLTKRPRSPDVLFISERVIPWQSPAPHRSGPQRQSNLSGYVRLLRKIRRCRSNRTELLYSI